MAGYTRQEAANIVTSATIQASHFNNEFNQVQSAFNASTGHTHAGGTGEGAPIPVAGLAFKDANDSFLMAASGTITSGAEDAVMIGGQAASTIGVNADSAVVIGGSAAHTVNVVNGVAIGGGLVTINTNTGGFGYSCNGATITAFYGGSLGGTSNIVSGTYAISAGGDTNTASGVNSITLAGKEAVASQRGQVAHATGKFSANGDAQTSQYIMRNQTTNGTTTSLYLDGVGDRLNIANDTAWMFEIKIVARRTDADGESAGYIMRGVINNDSNITSLVGSLTEEYANEDTSTWAVNAVADDANDALDIQVTGEASKTINWVAFVRTVEVTG